MKEQSILIVDDEKNIRLTMKKSLEPLGFPVRTAVNGEDALEKLREDSFAMVFLDLRMPGLDGMEVLRRIEAEQPQIQVVVITAHGTVETAVEAMKHGAADFLQKPFSPGEIQELATRVLKRKSLDDENAVDYPSLVELAKRHVSERDFRAARETIRKAIAADPAQPEAYNLLGALLEIKGDWLEGQKFYRAALDIDPTFPPARANLNRTTSLNKFGKIDIGQDATRKEKKAGRPGENGKRDEE
jgi:DNA-binding response OmpR family regulator